MSPARRCARRTLGAQLLAASVGLAALAGSAPRGHAQSPGLIPGVESWADAVSGRSTAKWIGQRVAFPEAAARPESAGYVDSLRWPFRVHLTRGRATDAALASEALRHAENAADLLAAAGLFPSWEPTDLYLVDSPGGGARVGEASVPAELDRAQAFAELDLRTPVRERAVCTAEALIDTALLRADPAESQSVRRAVASYFAWLLEGERCGDPAAETASLSFDATHLLRSPAALALWLRALGAARDQNRGVFVESMWQFARQLTWEGSGLRGSPDFFEAVAKAFQLGREQLEENAAQLAADMALRWVDAGPVPTLGAVRWSTLPAHLPPSAPLSPLDASLRLIDLEAPRPGERLSLWSRGEYGVRWALGATRLRADGSVISRQRAAVQKSPDGELQIELDAETRFVLVALVNMAQGIPDADLADDRFVRATRLIVDRAR